MTARQPRVTAKHLVRIARKLGFELDRQSGSHAIYFRAEDKRRIVIPIHAGKIIKPKTLQGIIKDLGIEFPEFRALL